LHVAIPYNQQVAKNTAAKVTRFELRLSGEADQLLAALSAHLGIAKAAVIEQAIRKLARAEGLAGSVAETRAPYTTGNDTPEH
jgi:predicted DNA-binding protein